MPTILYAEDDRDCRELFAFVLRQNDFTVYEANNGAQAVQIVRDEPIDLAILDIRMPMMTGYDAARTIARERPHVPVMFFTARNLSREVGRAFSCGEMVVDYLVKPVTAEKLVSRVDQILQGCQTRGLQAVRQESMTQLMEVQLRV